MVQVEECVFKLLCAYLCRLLDPMVQCHIWDQAYTNELAHLSPKNAIDYSTVRLA